MDGINVISNDLRSVIRKEVPFIPGAWVDFWDSFIMADLEKAQSQTNPDLKSGTDFLIKQISNWNFTDGTNPLPITQTSFQLLTDKLVTWLFTAQKEVLESSKEDKKKLLNNSSNT